MDKQTEPEPSMTRFFRIPFLFFIPISIILMHQTATPEETVTLLGSTLLEQSGPVIIRPITNSKNKKIASEEIRGKLDGKGQFSIQLPRSIFPARVILPLRVPSDCSQRPKHHQPFLSAMIEKPGEKRQIGVLSTLKDLHEQEQHSGLLITLKTLQKQNKAESLIDLAISKISIAETPSSLLAWAIVEDLSDGEADGLKWGKKIPLCRQWSPAILATSYLSRGLLKATDAPDQKRSRMMAKKIIMDFAHYAPPLGTQRISGPPLMVPRDSGALVTLSDGRVVSIGGEAAAGIVPTVEVFSPLKNKWEKTIPDYPLSVSYTAAASMPGNRIFVSGGFNSTGILREAFIYTPKTGTWNKILPDPVSRMGAVAISLPNGNVLVVGGQSESGFLSLAEEYSIRSGKWKTLPSAPTSRMGGTGVLLNNGLVLFMGGFEGENGISGTGNLYNPKTRVWGKSIRPSPTPRLYATSLLLPDGKVLMADGFNRNGVLDKLDIYDPMTNQWNSNVHPDITKRKELGAALLPDGRIMLVGGEDAGGNSIGSVTFLK